LIVSILERQLVDIFGKQIAVHTGVMQGSPLSPKLFTFVVDTAIRDCQILTTMTVSRNLFAYADDLATTLKNKAHAKEIMVAMDSLKSEKLFVNMSKTNSSQLTLELRKRQHKWESKQLRISTI